MGNELFSEYNIEKTPFLQGGYLTLWKIYKGIHKERKQEVCIFTFEKKDLERFTLQEQTKIISILKNEANFLIKYKHPNILSIIEPLIEDNNTLGFVTEPFSYTLTSWIESLNPSKLEIKQMVIDIIKIINFLHNDAHVIHCNLNPDVIFIDKLNKIKLSGFSFAINDPPINQGSHFYTEEVGVPYLAYTAPELILKERAYYNSDIFSIGLIIYTLLKYNKGDTERMLLNLPQNKINFYKAGIDGIENKLNRLNFEFDDNDVIKQCLNVNEKNRIGIKELNENVWFNDPKLKTLNFIENLNLNDVQKNIQFLQQFPKIVNKFEKKIINFRFLPCLINSLGNEQIINQILPCIFCISENEKLKINFSSEIWPHIKNLFKLKSLPAVSIYFLISKIEYIGNNISNSEFNNHLLNLICKAMDSNVVKIQMIISKNLPFIMKKIDSLNFKNNIYPRLISIINTTGSIELKIDLLKQMKDMYKILDQNLINENFLSNLDKIRKSNNNNEICMIIVDIYEEIAKVVNTDGIATKILPGLITMLSGGNVTKKNFLKLYNIVQMYLERIKNNRINDLSDDDGIVIDNNLKYNKKKEDNFIEQLMDNNNNNQEKKNNNNNGNIDFLNSFLDNNVNNNNLQNNNNNNFNLDNFNLSNNNNNNFNSFNTNNNNNEKKKKQNLFHGVSNINKSNNNLFAGLNTNTVGNINNNNNNFINFDLTNNNYNNNNNFNNNNNKKDDLLNQLMNDLPNSMNLNNNNNSNNNLNTFDLTSNSYNKLNNNFNNINNNLNSFNEDNLDFLSPSKTNNNLNYNFTSNSNNNNNQTNLNTFSFV